MNWWDSYLNGSQRGRVPPEKLQFDVTNPRYTPEKRPASDADSAIIQHLDRTADLGELLQSIASSGYVDIEPLIVIDRHKQLVVLEGNRRLAALKCLLDPELAIRANVAVPDLEQAVLSSLSPVSVYLVQNEDEARDLIGFKHINGPQTWDAYAKALYAARWLDEQQTRGPAALSLTEIAARMGDKHDTLFRIVSAVYVLRQAEEVELFRVGDRFTKNFSFSHLYTALTYSEYREFLGLPRADRTTNPPKNPITKDFYPHLQMLLTWLYGSKAENRPPIIKSQNPDLANLKRVLGHPTARRALMERGDFGEALSMTISSSERFDRALFDARANLTTASGELANCRADEELLGVSAEIQRRANLIQSTLASMISASGQPTPGTD